MVGRVISGKVAVSRTSLPVIGKIRIGEKRLSASGQEYPASVDWFLFDSDKYGDDARKVFGDKPRHIEVVFLYDEFDKSCFEQFECRDGAGKLLAKGDGQQFYSYNANTRTYDLCSKESVIDAGTWAHVLRLTFAIPRLEGIFGLWEFKTKAKESSIPQIRDAFDFVQGKAGTVKGIPFDLSVEMVTSNKPGEKRKYPVVKLVPNVSTESIQIVRRMVEAGRDIPLIISNEALKALPEADVKQLPAQEG